LINYYYYYYYYFKFFFYIPFFNVPLDQLIDLSPRGSYGRWVPLYQVTVCLPTQSMYTRLTSEEEHPVMSSFAIVMAR